MDRLPSRRTRWFQRAGCPRRQGPNKTKVYRTRDLAKADIFEYIEMFYNRTQRHSHLGGVSPEAFEAASSVGLYMSTILGKSIAFGDVSAISGQTPAA